MRESHAECVRVDRSELRVTYVWSHSKNVTLEGREGLDVVLQSVTGEGKEFCNVCCQLVVKIFLNTFNTFIEINSLLGFD